MLHPSPSRPWSVGQPGVLGEPLAEPRTFRNGSARSGPSLYFRARMPKTKSHSGAKLQARHAFSSHLLGKKSPKRKRSFSLDRDISKADRKTVTKLLSGKAR